MTTDHPNPSKPRRRWFQFSLRTLFVLVTVLCVWLAVVVNRARKQREAVAAIEELGGGVYYDYQFPGRFLVGARSPFPTWLWELLGDDLLHTVVCVALEDIVATNADLVHMADLNDVEYLYLGGSQITDSEFVHLKDLRELRRLILWGNPITGKGLKHLKASKGLRHLDLSQTQVRDDQLTSLQELVSLERLDIPNNPQLDGSFIEYLTGLPSFKSLNVRGNGITDAGLKHIGDITNLTSLMLDNTRVTDAGLVHLKGLSNLVYLDLDNTQVTDEGVKKLQQALPNCVINR